MVILYISNYCLGVNSYDFDHSIMINHDSQIRKLVTMMKSNHHYNDFYQIFAWRSTPPLFRHRITILVQCWLSLEKNKIEVSKWSKKNLALKIHNLMKKQDTPSSLRPSSRSPAWEVCPSLSWPASPLPLWPSLSRSENWRRWTYNRQNISALRVYGSNLPIKIAPCIIVKTIAWKI